MIADYDENRLIQLAGTGNSHAVEALVTRYRPLIASLAKCYHIRLYDWDDWLQEARLACFLTCQRFDPTNGSKFGSFFKLCFQNTIYSKLRHQLAQKRQGDSHATSLEKLLQEESDGSYSTSLGSESRFPVLADFAYFATTLTPVERQAWLLLVGAQTLNECSYQSGANTVTIKNAQGRVKLKMKQFLLDANGKH